MHFLCEHTENEDDFWVARVFVSWFGEGAFSNIPNLDFSFIDKIIIENLLASLNLNLKLLI